MPQKRKHDASLECKYAWLLGLAGHLGFKVVDGKEDLILIEDKIITINPRQPTFKKIIGLAHELGHAVTLPACVEQFGKRVIYGNVKYWPSLEAELLAWSAADAFMGMLGLYNNKYVKLKHTFLRGYYRITKKKNIS